MIKTFKIGKYDFSFCYEKDNSISLLEVEIFSYPGVAIKTLVFANSRLKPKCDYYVSVPMPKFMKWFYIDLNKYYMPIAATLIFKFKTPVKVEVK
jgi:hypothetical protein